MSAGVPENKERRQKLVQEPLQVDGNRQTAVQLLITFIAHFTFKSEIFLGSGIIYQLRSEKKKLKINLRRN